MPQQHPSYFSVSSNSVNSAQQTLIQQLLRQRTEMMHPDGYHQRMPIEESIRYTQQPNFTNAFSKIKVFISIFIRIFVLVQMTNTPVASPYASHASPVSNLPNGNNNLILSNNSMEQSPANCSIASSCSSSSSSNTAPKKRFLKAVKQESEEDKIVPLIDYEPPVIEQTTTLTIVPDVDSPTKKSLSGFLIGTPSSTGASSSSSTSSQTHFNYDNIPTEKKRESTPSSFQWPSQFRRQMSSNLSNQTIGPVPTTPYTPPPMLSPFRKGPGLYYRVFSQPGTASDTPSIPTTPILDESANPKINIGRDYQASIPKYRPERNSSDNELTQDELLFSPTDLPELDEKALELFEQLNRSNPCLFSPRNNPTPYSIELVYMLLYEYNGNLQRTLATLLEGTANDIKECRPIHRYRFSECDMWTPTEIETYSKTIQNHDKNFEVVSRAVSHSFSFSYLFLN